MEILARWHCVSGLSLRLLIHPVIVLSLDEETRAPAPAPSPAAATAVRLEAVSVNPETPCTYPLRGPEVDTNIILSSGVDQPVYGRRECPAIRVRFCGAYAVRLRSTVVTRTPIN